MIIKCIRGDNFPGLVDYIMRRGRYAASGEKPRELECEGLFSSITSAAELAQQASLAPSRTKRAVHLLGRAEKGLTDEQFRQAGRRTLAAAGLGGRPFILVVHDDDGHFHLATVEVDENGLPPPRRLVSASLKREVTAEEAAVLPPGNVSSRSWDSHLAWRLTKVSRELEIEFDLRQLGNDRDTYDTVRIPTWQLKREDELGIVPLAKAMADEMKAALDLPTWDERDEALAILGLGIRAYEGANKTRRGLQIYALGDPANFCNGSQLGKAYGLATIEQKSDQPFEAWLGCRANDRCKSVELISPPVAAEVTSNGNRQDDQGLNRVRAEYAAYRIRHREERDKRRAVSKRLVVVRRKDRAIVRILRQQLLASGRVSKSWAHLICQVARTELEAETAAQHLREKADLATLPERRLTWLEFLAEAAARDREAIRIQEQEQEQEQERRRADEDQRARERALAAERAAAREHERRISLEQAAAEKAASERAAAERIQRLREDEDKRVLERQRQLLPKLHAELALGVRIASPDDHATVLTFLADWPEYREVFTAINLTAEIATMMNAVHQKQQARLSEALKFVGAVEDVELFEGNGVPLQKVEDSSTRLALISTLGWPEIAEAIQARRQLLARQVAIEAIPSGKETPQPRELEVPAHTDARVREVLQRQIASSPAPEIGAGVREDQPVEAPVQSKPPVLASTGVSELQTENSTRGAQAPISRDKPPVKTGNEEAAASANPIFTRSAAPELRTSAKTSAETPNIGKTVASSPDIEKKALAEKFLDKKSKPARQRLDGEIRNAVRKRAAERSDNVVAPAVDHPQSVRQHQDGRPAPLGQILQVSSAVNKAQEMTSNAEEIEPEYIRVDREFAEREIAEGRDVGGKRLKFWREQMTCANTPFYRSDGDADVIALAVENERDWVEAVKKLVDSSLADDQIVRYLTLTVPLLPPASRSEASTVTVGVISHDESELAHLALLQALMKARGSSL